MSVWAIIVNSIALLALTTVIVRLIKVERSMKALGAPPKPFWAALQTKLVKDLTHPSPQFHEMDELMRELESLTISPERRERLIELLVERTTSQDPEVSDSERSSAKMMLEAMGKVMAEADIPVGLVDVQLVGSKPEPKPETDKE